MTDRKVMIPVGYIWLADAFHRVADLVIEKAKKEGDLLRVTNPWYLYYLNDAVDILQVALLSAELQAHYFSDDEMNDVAIPFWRKEEADRTIRRGEIQVGDGNQIEFVFLNAKLFVNFTRSYSMGEWPLKSEGEAIREQGEIIKPSRTRGRRPEQRSRVETEMRTWQAATLASLTEEAMVSEFGASRDTCRKARDAVLSEIGKPIPDK